MDASSSRLLQQSPDAIASRLMQKAQNQDGLPEIAIGVILLTAAALQWLQIVSPIGSFVHKQSALGYGLIVSSMILGAQWAIKTLRRNFLIDRVGYVEFKPVNRKRHLTAFAIAFLFPCVLTFAVVTRSLPPRNWLVAITGICGGILAIQVGRLPRFVVGGVLMAVTSVVLLLMRVSLEWGMTILFGSMGLLSLISGCVVFVLFIRKPVPAEE